MTRMKNLTEKGSKTTTFYDGTVISEPAIARFFNQSQSDITHWDFKSPLGYHFDLVDSKSEKGTQVTNNASDPPTWIIVDGILSDTPYSGDTSRAASIADMAAFMAESKLTEMIRGSMDLSESLAQTGQTYRMLNVVQRFTQAVVSMRKSFLREVWRQFNGRGSRHDRANALQRWQRGYALKHPYYEPIPINRGVVDRVSSLAANGWLEFTYGLKPLCSDIYGIASNILGFTRNELLRFAARGEEVSDSWYSDLNGPFERRTNVKITAYHRIGVQMKTGFDPGLSKWANLNPLSLAYALVPGSFVLDWFLDVGGYLRNAETAALYNKSFLTGYRTAFTKIEIIGRTQGKVVNGIQIIERDSISNYRHLNMTRTVMVSYPWPSLPKFNVNMGSSRMLSAAALLRGLIR